MDPVRTSGTAELPSSTLHSISGPADWKTLAAICMIAILYFAAPTGLYPLMVPGEARHAGIAHDMWMAHQYVVPRVDGMPLLDGAPLHRWVALVFLAVLGSSEWALRLPSAIWAGLTLVVMCRLFPPWRSASSAGIVCAVMLLQPAIMFAGRLAVPDMLNVFLLTVACGAFLQAALHAEEDHPYEGWMAGAWGTTGLLGLGAGPVAMVVPVCVVGLWLLARKRPDLLWTLCWWPGPAAAVLMVVPWFTVVSDGDPGMIAAMLKASVLPLWSLATTSPIGHWLGLRGGLMLASLVPVAVCMVRYRHPARRAALRTPTAGFMAAWLVIVLPLHPLLAMTAAGCAAFLVVPLVYFSVLALEPTEDDTRRSRYAVRFLHIAATLGMALLLLNATMLRVSTIPPVARAMADYYVAATDKVIMLDRYHYAFNFYLHSPKLVFVAADWSLAEQASAPLWMRELAESGRHEPETADRMLLTHEAFMARVCGRRVVNLWIVADEDAPLRHPILSDLTVLPVEGKVRAWYLDVEDWPASCGERPGPRDRADPSAGWEAAPERAPA